MMLVTIDMKNLILFFFVTIFYNGLSFAQFEKAKINYKVGIYKSENVKNSSKTFDLIFNEIKNINFELIYDGENASFTDVNDTLVDYMNINKRAKLIADLKDSYYYNLRDKKIIRKRKLNESIHFISDSYNKYNWKLTEETKTIENYTCYKAITKKPYRDRKGLNTFLYAIAWYAPDLPISLGPKDYLNLPGLILELHECADLNHEVDKKYNKGRTYYVSKIDLNPNQILTIKMPKENNIITEQEFKEIQKFSYNY